MSAVSSSSSSQDRLKMREAPRLVTTQRTFTRRSSLMRQPSLCSLTPPPSATVSSASSFSFKSFWSSASLKSGSTVKTALTVPNDVSPLTARLVWGICGKNFKPGMLFTNSLRPASPPSPFSYAAEGVKEPSLSDGKLVFFPLGKSFKTQCIDEPHQIIARMIEAFQLAQQIIPENSKFANCLTQENYARLVELKYQANKWLECGKVDAKYMIPTIAQNIPAALVDTLSYQPDVWELLGEAAKVFSCETLDIPSPCVSHGTSAGTTAAGTSHSNPSSASMLRKPPTPPTRERERPDWTDLEKHTYRGVLQTHLARLIETDALLHVPKRELERLADIFTETQLSLNMWFAPYSRASGEMEGAAAFVEDALCAEDGRLRGAELTRMMAQAEALAEEWMDKADGLKAWEGDMNVWTLAMQKVLGAKGEMEKVGKLMVGLREEVEVDVALEGLLLRGASV